MAHSIRTAPRPPVRALCAAFPSRSPLLPAQTCSRRAASVFPTSPPQQDKRARSGTLQLCSASKQTTGETNTETHWGNPEPPPAPGKPRPRFQVPQTPPASPKTTTDPAAQMTGESARHRPRIPRRTCRTRKLQGPGEPGKPPKARFPRFPRTPSRPSPGPRARCARQDRLAYRADPGHHGNQQPGRRHPGSAPTRPARKPAHEPPAGSRTPAAAAGLSAGPGSPRALHLVSEPAPRAGVNRAPGRTVLGVAHQHAALCSADFDAVRRRCRCSWTSASAGLPASIALRYLQDQVPGLVTRQRVAPDQVKGYPALLTSDLFSVVCSSHRVLCSTSQAIRRRGQVERPAQPRVRALSRRHHLDHDARPQRQLRDPDQRRRA